MLTVVARSTPVEVVDDPQAALIYLGSLGSDASRATIQYALEVAARSMSSGAAGWSDFPWRSLRYEHVQRLRTVLSGSYAPATANKILCAVRGVLRECWRLRLVDADTYQRVADVDGVKGFRLPAGRMVGADEIERLLGVCAADRSPAGRRDEALLGMMVAAGLRREEAARLDLEHLDLEGGECRVLRAKGNKDRVTWIGDDALHLMRGWLRVRGLEPGPLFFPINRHGTVERRRLTGQSIYMIATKRQKEADLPSFSLHDLRRTYISRLLDEGQDLVTVSKMVGHSSTTTTARYDRRDHSAMKRAANVIRLPLPSSGGA